MKLDIQLKGPMSWRRLGVFYLFYCGLLALTELFITQSAGFTAGLNSAMISQGYLFSLQILTLLLWVGLGLLMTLLLQEGFIVAPLMWVVQVLRLALTGYWPYMASNILFEVAWLNLVFMILVPVGIGIGLWYCQKHFGAWKSSLLLPGMWILLVVLISVSNLFSWHWSRYTLGQWPHMYGGLLLFIGIGMVLFYVDKRPLAVLGTYLAGLILPLGLGMVIWDFHQGLTLLLPAMAQGFLGVWLELMSMVFVPIFLVLGIDQGLKWRRGEKLIDLY